MARRQAASPPEGESVLTVEEAAAELRIGRRLAYELAARFEQSGGAEGLPVIRLGRCLRVPRARLEALLAADPPAPPALALRRVAGGTGAGRGVRGPRRPHRP